MSTPAATVPTQFIHTIGPRPTPEAYVVPGSLEIQLSSVSAEFDGSAAGGNFDPTLSVYSKDGLLVSRTKVGSTVTAGDSAVCTWIPFSRPRQVAPTPGTSLKAIRLWTSNMNLVIGSANDGRASYDHASSFDSSVFAVINSGGRTIRVQYKAQGWYSTYAQVVPSAFAAGSVNMHFLYVGDTLSGSTVATESALVGLHVGPYPSISITRYWPDAFDSLPGLTELWIAQNSGVNMTINQSDWMHVFHGDSDF